MKQKFTVKQNNGSKVNILGNQDELEMMYQKNIIDGYVLTNDSITVDDIYKQYIITEFESKADEVCLNIQDAKKINNGDLPPDLGLDLGMAIDNLANVIMKIINHQKNVDKEEN